jgi:CHAT domain-containing protein
MQDILSLQLNRSDWVILSACNTAAPGGTGEGLSGLTRAFFYAGAPSLLVSQWSVDDAATDQLMTNVLGFYSEHRSASRSDALKNGMQKLMAQDANGDHTYFAHPFAWAPFFIAGEGGPAATRRKALE